MIYVDSRVNQGWRSMFGLGGAGCRQLVVAIYLQMDSGLWMKDGWDAYPGTITCKCLVSSFRDAHLAQHPGGYNFLLSSTMRKFNINIVFFVFTICAHVIMYDLDKPLIIYTHIFF